MNSLCFQSHPVNFPELSRHFVLVCVNSKSVMYLQLQKNNVSQYSFKNHKEIMLVLVLEGKNDNFIYKVLYEGSKLLIHSIL